MQETRTFVRLEKLQNIAFDGETAEQKARWIANVLGSVGEHGYSFATTQEGDEDTAEFTCAEMEFASVDVYDFMGSALEEERFYARDIVTFRNIANGEYYVLNAENLWEF